MTGSGFSPAVFAEMLAGFRRLRRDEFDLDDAQYERLAREVERWREFAVKLGHRREPGQGRDARPEYEV